MRILVAEDDLISRTLLTRMATGLGHEVRAVDNGRRAWSEVQAFKPHVLITDWMMPEMDGLELTCRVRGRKSGTYCWVIMLTAREFRENYVMSMRAGVDDYLQKPLDKDLLMVRLDVASRVLHMTNRLEELEACLPMCMHCRSVKDEAQQWQRLERYVADHAQLQFSHGFCPDCFFAKVVMPELAGLASGPETDAGAVVNEALRQRLDATRGADAQELARDVSTYLQHVSGRLDELGESLRSTRRLDESQRRYLCELPGRIEVLGTTKLHQALVSMVAQPTEEGLRGVAAIVEETLGVVATLGTSEGAPRGATMGR